MPTTDHRRQALRAARRGGFTLMELLLVLAILVILGSMAVGLFTGVGERAKVDAAKGQIGIFKRQVRLYHQLVNQYPTSLNDLIQQPSNLKSPDKWTKLLEENKLPLDPWDNDYRFAQPGQHNLDGFDVWSVGPDSADGTADDIGNWD